MRIVNHNFKDVNLEQTHLQDKYVRSLSASQHLEFIDQKTFTQNDQRRLQLDLNRGPCQLSNSKLNLLGLGNDFATTRQSDYFDDNRAQTACDGQLTNLGQDSLMHTGQARDNYWQVTFSSQVSVKTILILNRDDCCQSRIQDVQISVGNSHPYLNQICIQRGQITDGGWYMCDQTLRGRNVDLLSAFNYINVYEIMIYSQEVIQMQGKTKFFGLESTKDLASNALLQKVVLYANRQNTCATIVKNGVQEPVVDLILPAQSLINSITLLPKYSDGQTLVAETHPNSLNVDVFAVTSQGEIKCGSFADYFTYSEVQCQTQATTIRLKTNKNVLEFCGLGIMSDCECATTSLDPNMFQKIYEFVSPKEINVNQYDALQTFTFETKMPDTVGTVCSPYDGLSLCGQRIYNFYKHGTQDQIDAPGITVGNGTIIFDPSKAQDITEIEAQVMLKNYQEIRYSERITARVTRISDCKLNQDKNYNIRSNQQYNFFITPMDEDVQSYQIVSQQSLKATFNNFVLTVNSMDQSLEGQVVELKVMQRHTTLNCTFKISLLQLQGCDRVQEQIEKTLEVVLQYENNQTFQFEDYADDCGQTTMSLDNQKDYNKFDLQGRMFSKLPSTQAGNYTVTLRYQYKDSPTGFKYQQVNIKIVQNCHLSTISQGLPQLKPINYSLGSSEVTTSIPACLQTYDYCAAVSYSYTPALPFITLQKQQITLATKDFKNVGTYEIVVSCKTQSSSSQQKLFLNITNPCNTAIDINPIPLTFSLQNPITYNISQLVKTQQLQNLCGEVRFKTSSPTIKIFDGMLTQPPNPGQYYVQISASYLLADSSWNPMPVQFNIEVIDECEFVTYQTTNPPQWNYTLGQPQQVRTYTYQTYPSFCQPKDQSIQTNLPEVVQSKFVQKELIITIQTSNISTAGQRSITASQFNNTMFDLILTAPLKNCNVSSTQAAVQDQNCCGQFTFQDFQVQPANLKQCGYSWSYAATLQDDQPLPPEVRLDGNLFTVTELNQDITVKLVGTLNNPQRSQALAIFKISKKISKTQEPSYIDEILSTFLKNKTKNDQKQVPSKCPQLQKGMISREGLMQLAFSPRFLSIPQNFTVNSTYLQINLIQNQNQFKNFTWNMTSFDNQTLKIQLYFNEPVMISQDGVFDELKVIFLDRFIRFIDQQCHRNLQQVQLQSKQIQLVIKVPKQLELGLAQQLLKVVTEIANPASNAVILSNTVVQLFMSGSLAMLWAMVNALQLQVAMILLNIEWPANTLVLFQTLQNIASFNAIPTADVTASIFQFSNTEETSENFQAMGYVNKNFVQNLGLSFYLITFLLILVILQPLIQLIGRQIPKIKSKTEQLKKSIYWNSFIRLALENQLNFAICGILSSDQLVWTNFSDYFTSLLSIFCLTVVVIFPFISTVILVKCKKKLSQENFDQRYGSLAENIKDRSAVYTYTPYFCLRRAALVAIIFMVRRHPSLQLILNTVLAILDLCYKLHFCVNETKLDRNLDLLNDMMTLVLSNQFYLITDFVGDKKTQYHVGYSMCVVILVMVIANLIALIYVSIKKLALKWKKFLFLRKQAKNQKLKKQVVKQPQPQKNDIILEILDYSVDKEAQNIQVDIQMDVTASTNGFKKKEIQDLMHNVYATAGIVQLQNIQSEQQKKESDRRLIQQNEVSFGEFD